MKKIGIGFLFALMIMLFDISAKPTYIPKEFISYWPLLVGSAAYILFVLSILLLIKRTFYQNQKLPTGEIFGSAVFIVAGIAAISLVFLHP